MWKLQNTKKVKHCSVLIIEKSYLIRKTLSNLLDEMLDACNIISMEDKEDIDDFREWAELDFLFINMNSYKILKNVLEKKLSKLSRKPAVIFLSDRDIRDASYSVINIYQTKSALQKQLHQLTGRQQSKTNVKEEALSKREIEILKNIAKGKTNKEIAEKLYISSHTVITHRKNITRKLGIKTVSGLTVYALINNYINLNEMK